MQNFLLWDALNFELPENLFEGQRVQNQAQHLSWLRFVFTIMPTTVSWHLVSTQQVLLICECLNIGSKKTIINIFQLTSPMPRLIVCTWGLGIWLEKEKSMNPDLFALPSKGIIQPALDGAGSKTPQKAPVPSAWKLLPWSGSMHFFPHPNEQHFMCFRHCKSVVQKSGTSVSQMTLSRGHTPGFSARKQCPNSHPLRVSALLPLQR